MTENMVDVLAMPAEPHGVQSKKNWPPKKMTKLTRREFRVVRVVRVVRVIRQHCIERLSHVGCLIWMPHPHGRAVIDI